MDNTEVRLLQALHRMLDGKPIKVDPKRKISPAAVEEEAGLASGISYYSLYSNTLAKIKEAKSKQNVDSGKSNHRKPSKTSDELKKAKQKNILLQEKVDELTKKLAFAEKCNAELFSLINAKTFDARQAEKSLNADAQS
ncbi:hypothetical protein [Vibrio sp. ArtGut-C1]|uniref:hypothetical protein n=1 Tax=Vibrio sp. ArtGut-C1 TaxID=2259137 RepID=UPI000A18F68D|nr:hypothetical protein [Vibrio sp. ArtGut-C1]